MVPASFSKSVIMSLAAPSNSDFVMFKESVSSCSTVFTRDSSRRRPSSAKACSTKLVLLPDLGLLKGWGKDDASRFEFTSDERDWASGVASPLRFLETLLCVDVSECGDKTICGTFPSPARWPISNGVDFGLGCRFLPRLGDSLFKMEGFSLGPSTGKFV